MIIRRESTIIDYHGPFDQAFRASSRLQAISVISVPNLALADRARIKNFKWPLQNRRGNGSLIFYSHSKRMWVLPVHQRENRENPTRVWIRVDICRHGGAICSKSRKIVHIIGARGSQDLSQGGKGPGGETASPLLDQCVMRRRTGTRVLSALPV